MGRSFCVLSLLMILVLFGSLVGCGGSSTGTSTTVPASIALSPAIASLDMGGTATLNATAKNFAGTPVTLTYAWTSSNPAVASVSTSGLVCAGTWDSRTNPVVCTPGAVGSAQITATNNGISSPPVTIYVHPHVDHLTITALAQPPGTPGPLNGCYATTSTTNPAETQTYQAQAFSNNVDISALVGPFNWATTVPQVATITELTGSNGVQNGQVKLTAKVPGMTGVFASISGTNSTVGQQTPIQSFTTCPVQKITVATPSGSTSFTGTKGTGLTAVATVTDINGNIVTGVPLTWISTQPEVATVSASGGVSNANSGGTSVSAACAPPSCNINLTTNSVPMQAVYATDSIAATWTPTSTTPTAPTVYVSTTGCSSSKVTPAQNCTSAIVPVSGSPPAFGGTAATTNIPNSFVFDPKGTTTYMGSATGLLQIAAGSPPTVSLLSTAVKGKILAIAQDGKRVIVSDMQDTPNQVFLYDGTASSPAISNFLITGATAATFSSDGLKAFIVAHDPAASPADHLYVYSNQMPLQTIPLSAQAFDVTVPGNGMFAFLAGGSSNGSSYLPVCDSTAPPGVAAVGGAPGTFIRQLPGNNLLTFNPPNLYTVSFTENALAATGPNAIGCPIPPLGPPGGIFTPVVTASSTMTVGQGTFTPLTFTVSPDGQKAYFLAPGVASLIIYDIQSQTSSTVPLVGNPAPLAGGLAPDGLSFYVTGFVIGSDGVTPQSSLHVINLSTGQDAAQLAITPQNLCAVSNGNVPPCVPDLLAVP